LFYTIFVWKLELCKVGANIVYNTYIYLYNVYFEVHCEGETPRIFSYKPMVWIRYMNGMRV
jgi:hypothetical protein